MIKSIVFIAALTTANIFWEIFLSVPRRVYVCVWLDQWWGIDFHCSPIPLILIIVTNLRSLDQSLL